MPLHGPAAVQGEKIKSWGVLASRAAGHCPEPLSKMPWTEVPEGNASVNEEEFIVCAKPSLDRGLLSPLNGSWRPASSPSSPIPRPPFHAVWPPWLLDDVRHRTGPNQRPSGPWWLPDSAGGCMGTWCMGTWAHGRMGTWAHECMGAYGCMGAWAHGCMKERTQ